MGKRNGSCSWNRQAGRRQSQGFMDLSDGNCSHRKTASKVWLNRVCVGRAMASGRQERRALLRMEEDEADGSMRPAVAWSSVSTPPPLGRNTLGYYGIGKIKANSYRLAYPGDDACWTLVTSVSMMMMTAEKGTKDLDRGAVPCLGRYKACLTGADGTRLEG